MSKFFVPPLDMFNGVCHGFLYKLFTFKCKKNVFHALSFLPVDGADVMSSGSLTFNFQVGTVSSSCINITINDDDDLEGDHTFDVTLGDTSTPVLLGGLGSPSFTTITIEDPEGILMCDTHT